ncbi:MAG: leucine-rich repeat domain-containing protein [Spirochaetales bacterium]|nr:leucine-rich repeat domain-containing protein [Spirochaetales bacterium]
MKFSNGIRAIPARCFSFCEELKEMIIPSTVNSLGEDCFYGCSSLKRVEINGEVREIPSRCFMLCGELREIILPASLEKIEEFAFELCTNLTDIYYKGTMEQWREVQYTSIGFQVPATVVHCKDGDVPL